MEITLDDLQNGYFIYQPKNGFRFGMDAVLLSYFAEVRNGEKVIDLGTGTGIIPVLLAAKTKGKHFTGLEIQEESALIAQKSVEYNKLEERISIVQGDIKEASEIFGRECFNVVVSNPPYMINAHGLRNELTSKYIARHEALCNFDDIAREASRILVSKGRMFLVHRPFRLAELFDTLKKHHLEPKRMRLVHPYVDREPNMVLIEAMKGANSGMIVERPLIVYKEPGVYTDDVLNMYSSDNGI